jgi:hypothetical protein
MALSTRFAGDIFDPLSAIFGTMAQVPSSSTPSSSLARFMAMDVHEVKKKRNKKILPQPSDPSARKT